MNMEKVRASHGMNMGKLEQAMVLIEDKNGRRKKQVDKRAGRH